MSSSIGFGTNISLYDLPALLQPRDRISIVYGAKETSAIYSHCASLNMTKVPHVGRYRMALLG